MIIKIEINELNNFPKDEWDYTDEQNPILISSASYRYNIIAQKESEAITYISGDIDSFKSSTIEYIELNSTNKNSINGFKDISRGKIIDWKYLREHECKHIEVELESGVIVQGDEESQGRISRAIKGLEYALELGSKDSISWKDINNNFISLSKDNLKEALFLAGNKQTQIWAKWG